MKSADDQLPLKPRVMMMLLELSKGPRHAYALKEELRDKTSGGMDLGPGTLYRTVRELEARKLIEELDGQDLGDDDERRRYYRITRFGKRVLATELERLSGLVEEGRRARII